MKKLLLTSFLFLLALPAMAADNGVWFNSERNGEGINLITRDEVALIYFFTYVDNTDTIPPSGSPVPPEVPLINKNSTTWYLAVGFDYNGEQATGDIYVAQARNYPIAIDGALADAEKVGTFTLLRLDDGWLLDVNYAWNYIIPWYVSLYDIHEFPTPFVLLD